MSVPDMRLFLLPIPHRVSPAGLLIPSVILDAAIGHATIKRSVVIDPGGVVHSAEVIDLARAARVVGSSDYVVAASAFIAEPGILFAPTGSSPRDQLHAVLTAHRALCGRYGFAHSIEGVLLASGQNYHPAALPSKYDAYRQPPGRCREATVSLVRDHPDLIPCQGYAIDRGSFAFAHTWAIDPTGAVVDATWGFGIAGALIGIPLPRAALLADDAVRDLSKLVGLAMWLLSPRVRPAEPAASS